MKHIYLENDHAARLETFLLMTTKYREDEVTTWVELANERNEDGTIKYPNANGNADFWNETIGAMSAVVEAINRAESI